MADFGKALKHTLQWEGGFVDDPLDNGGATNKGITLRTYRYHFGKEKAVEDLMDIAYDEVEYIYRIGYWDNVKGDDINNQSFAELLFDSVVNMGGRPIKAVQEYLNVAADGVVGKQTVAAINGYGDKRQLFEYLWKWRSNYYHGIVERNPNQKRFLIGWLNRLSDFKYKR